MPQEFKITLFHGHQSPLCVLKNFVDLKNGRDYTPLKKTATLCGIAKPRGRVLRFSSVHLCALCG